MRQSWLALAFLILISALVLAAFAIRTLPAPQRDTAEDASDLPAIDVPSVDFANPSKGALDAVVRIVQYGDFLCASCAQLAPDLDRLLEDYAGSVRVVWKDFPNTSAHPGTDTASIAARCAQRQGAFWEYHDLLLIDRIAVTEASLVSAAEALGLDAESFRTCLITKETVPMIDRDFVEGQILRVDGTPYLFVNDRRVSGSISYDQLAQIVEALGAVPVTPSN